MFWSSNFYCDIRAKNETKAVCAKVGWGGWQCSVGGWRLGSSPVTGLTMSIAVHIHTPLGSHCSHNTQWLQCYNTHRIRWHHRHFQLFQKGQEMLSWYTLTMPMKNMKRCMKIMMITGRLQSIFTMTQVSCLCVAQYSKLFQDKTPHFCILIPQNITLIFESEVRSKITSICLARNKCKMHSNVYP